MKKKTIIILTTTIIILITLGIAGYLIYDRVLAISNFDKYITNYKKEMNNYIYDDDEKSEYQKLIDEAKIIINKKDCKGIKGMKKKLDTFKESLIEVNKSIMESYKSEVEAIDISKLSDESKESIGTQVENIELMNRKNNYVKMEELYITLIDFIKNTIIEENYQNLDGYWISGLDDNYMNLRIDLKNNTYTPIYTLAEGFRLTITDHKYDKEIDGYKLVNTMTTSGPHGEAGRVMETSVKYIDENHIEIDNIKLYKVSYEQAIYHYIYCRLIDRFETIEMKFDFFETFTLPKQYTNGSSWKNAMSEETAKDIVLTRIYDEDIIENDKKLAITYEWDPDEIPLYDLEKVEVLPGVEFYYYNAKTFKAPNAPEYYENNDIILGNSYCETRCYSEGFILSNGIVLQTLRYDDKAGTIDDFKKEILKYYK